MIALGVMLAYSIVAGVLYVLLAAFKGDPLAMLVAVFWPLAVFLAAIITPMWATVVAIRGIGRLFKTELP